MKRKMNKKEIETIVNALQNGYAFNNNFIINWKELNAKSSFNWMCKNQK